MPSQDTNPSEPLNEGSLYETFLHSLGRSYANGWSGDNCILPALRAAEETGVPAQFFIADHHLSGDRVYERISIALGRSKYGGNEWRYCGEGESPVSAGSHALTPGSDDLVVAAVALAFDLAHSARAYGPDVHVFRFKR